MLNEYDSVLEQRFRLEGPRSLGRPALDEEAARGPQEDRAGLVGFISSRPVAGELVDWPSAASAENRQIAHDLKKYSADSEEIGMNNKKTGPIFSLVPRDRRSTYLVICTSTRRTFVRILLTSIYVITTLVTSFSS